MKITSKVLHIPPHISTAWSNVAALRMEEHPNLTRPILIIQLVDGTSVSIPDLNQTILDRIFEAHAEFLEDAEMSESHAFSGQGQDGMMGLPFKIGPGGMEGVGAALQHDPTQGQAPDLPDEILQKIAGIANVLGVDEAATLPEPHENCNCFHCQIARAIHRGVGSEEESTDEEVSDEDLNFRTWDIQESGDHLYTVTNRLDPNEQYNVYLGDPIGCTCGDKDCEHIKSVLLESL